MFRIAVQTGGLEEIYGIDGAYRAIKEAGFDGVDANIDHLISGKDIINQVIPAYFEYGANDSEVVEACRPWKEAAKKYGLENYQAHAPFPSYVYDDGYPDRNDWIIEMLKRTIRGCASMDCRNLIIHPFFCKYEYMMTHDEEWEVNIDRYMRLAPVAKEYGVKINLENMFTTHKGKRYASVCNEGREAAKYVDTLNGLAGENVFGFCFDTGHALLVGRDVKEFMKDMGGRITAFHVHDNNGTEDQHQAPYTGVLDWNRFIEGLAEIGFDKTLSFETFAAVLKTDSELVPQTLKYIAEAGRMFDRRAEALRK